MAKFSQKMMGKEVGPASVYAKPHTSEGKNMNVKSAQQKQFMVGQDPNNLTAAQATPRTAVMRVSTGDPAANDVKTSGIKIRGTGAATKGVMARGPMA
jgi:hypothetical protein